MPDFASLLVDLLPLFSTPLFPDHHNNSWYPLYRLFIGRCDVFLSIQKAHSMRTYGFLNRLHLLCLFSLWAIFIANSVTSRMSLMSWSNWTLKYLVKTMWIRNKTKVIFMLCSQPSPLSFFVYTIVQYLQILVKITNESAMTFHSQRKYRKWWNLVRKSPLLNKLFSFCFFLVISFFTLKNTILVRPKNTAQGDVSAWNCLHFKAKGAETQIRPLE